MAAAAIDTKPLSERWSVIYPVYMNSKKTRKEGRLMPLSKSVDNPKVNEIKDVLEYLGVTCQVEENKLHPRDSSRDALCKGRVRVQLKDEEGKIITDKYPNKNAVMADLGVHIPKLKSRQSKSNAAEGSVATTSKKKDKKKK